MVATGLTPMACQISRGNFAGGSTPQQPPTTRPLSRLLGLLEPWRPGQAPGQLCAHVPQGPHGLLGGPIDPHSALVAWIYLPTCRLHIRTLRRLLGRTTWARTQGPGTRGHRALGPVDKGPGRAPREAHVEPVGGQKRLTRARGPSVGKSRVKFLWKKYGATRCAMGLV